MLQITFTNLHEIYTNLHDTTWTARIYVWKAQVDIPLCDRIFAILFKKRVIQFKWINENWRFKSTRQMKLQQKRFQQRDISTAA